MTNIDYPGSATYTEGRAAGAGDNESEPQCKELAVRHARSIPNPYHYCTRTTRYPIPLHALPWTRGKTARVAGLVAACMGPKKGLL